MCGVMLVSITHTVCGAAGSDTASSLPLVSE